MSSSHKYCRRALIAAMPRALVFALALAVFATAASLTLAADRTIILKVGATSALLLERPFNTMLIGDPDVVDVLVRDDRSVILQPLKPGATNIIFLDGRSIAIANVGILVCNLGVSAITYPDKSGCEHVDEQPT
jgi:Flp pilus assembly secretin CpaC